MSSESTQIFARDDLHPGDFISSDEMTLFRYSSEKKVYYAFGCFTTPIDFWTRLPENYLDYVIKFTLNGPYIGKLLSEGYFVQVINKFETSIIQTKSPVYIELKIAPVIGSSIHGTESLSSSIAGTESLNSPIMGSESINSPITSPAAAARQPLKKKRKIVELEAVKGLPFSYLMMKDESQPWIVRHMGGIPVVIGKLTCSRALLKEMYHRIGGFSWYADVSPLTPAEALLVSKFDFEHWPTILNTLQFPQ